MHSWLPNPKLARLRPPLFGAALEPLYLDGAELLVPLLVITRNPKLHTLKALAGPGLPEKAPLQGDPGASTEQGPGQKLRLWAAMDTIPEGRPPGSTPTPEAGAADG